jgi:hypothetical protein
MGTKSSDFYYARPCLFSQLEIRETHDYQSFSKKNLAKNKLVVVTEV